MLPAPSTSLVTRLTPPGQGAIATLGIRGPAAWDAIRDLFRPSSGKTLPTSPRSGQFWLGHCGDEIGDEVVLAVRDAAFEIHAHGGRAVVQMLLDLFEKRGLTLRPWQEYVRQTNPIQTDAMIALVQTTTARTAAIVLDQYQGAFSTATSAALAALDRGDSNSALGMIRELTRWSRLGRRLTEPWRVIVAGAPNVGKSSLVNALAGYQRSIVATTPGTTRDVVTVRLAVDGWPIELCDTAGMRSEADPLEAAGIEQARQSMAQADLCLWVMDATSKPLMPTMNGLPIQLVVNKMDLSAAWDVDSMSEAVRVSAATGAGLGELCAAVARRLVPEVPPAGAAVPFTPRLCHDIEDAERFLLSGDLLAARNALTNAGEASEDAVSSKC